MIGPFKKIYVSKQNKLTDFPSTFKFNLPTFDVSFEIVIIVDKMKCDTQEKVL